MGPIHLQVLESSEPAVQVKHADGNPLELKYVSHKNRKSANFPPYKFVSLKILFTRLRLLVL
jgi:hypothetical protein